MVFLKPSSFFALVLVAFAGLLAVSAAPSPRPQDCGEQQGGHAIAMVPGVEMLIKACPVRPETR
ncbi:hypothetical protein PYCCODRAFT_1439079 [Trametes coccinea BRFM310]|uniref:Uncharacterized protein n=1 Tax=Trametes coccinea (strain BRFM310) TaxID=1353009 RepID=A0A1Y2IBP6_TRAC3|nr:hypothetical protein PYCCODRAFT_1439079 [Trametes coccinea BRFM310]